MWQSESSQNTTLSSHNEQLFSNSHRTDNIFRLLSVVKLIHVVDLVDIRFIINEPTYLPAHLPVTYLG